MDKLLTAIEDFASSYPWLMLAAGAGVVVLLIIVMIAMRRRHAAEVKDWQEECRRLSGRVDALETEKKEKTLLIEQEQAELTRSQEEFAAQIQARDEDFSARLQAKDEDFSAQLQAKDEDFSAQLQAKDEDFSARLQAKDEDFSARLQAKDEDFSSQLALKELDHAAQLFQKDQELAAMQAQIDQWRRDQDEITAEAHRTAERILEQAAQRLAESEEEVRKNRLIAAGSLTDARRRISEMLLTAAGELCKGIPANSPIGYAPVYSIEDAEAAPLPDEQDAEPADAE